MIEIFHVSDLHFKTFDSENAAAKHLLSRIADTYFNPKLENRYLLITGDVTDSGNVYEYGAAQDSLLPFKEKIIITPGNHDYATDNNGCGYSKDSARYFDNPFASGLRFEWAFFNKKVYSCKLFDQSDKCPLIMIGLNSCRKVKELDFAQGEIGADQLQELKSKLQEYERDHPHVPKLLFLHHIPHKDAYCWCGMTLVDWRALMKTIRKDESHLFVNVIAFGHQGKKMEPGDLEKRAMRPMELRNFNFESRKLSTGPNRETGDFVIDSDHMDGSDVLVLDANHSVEDQAFYHITWDGNNLVCAVRTV